MLYYAAPMEGFTDRVWRQTHQKWFGTQGAADRYYAPFISPPENRVLIKKKMAELAPEANPGSTSSTALPGQKNWKSNSTSCGSRGSTRWW